MSTQAQYATIGRIGKASFSTANTNRNGTGALAIAFTATPTKRGTSRIDRVVIEASGVTTAGMVRLYITKGIPGETIASISFVGTTATLTTSQPHGRKTGDLATVQNVLPDEFNVSDAAITVTGPSSYTYTMLSTPQNDALASDLGGYSTTPAVPDTQLWREVSVSAVTPSATVPTYFNTMASSQAQDAGYLPLLLPAGYSLRVSTHNAESFNAIVNGGDTA